MDSIILVSYVLCYYPRGVRLVMYYDSGVRAKEFGSGGRSIKIAAKGIGRKMLGMEGV